MENIVPGRMPKAAWMVCFAFLATLMCVLPVAAQEKASPPPGTAAQYESYIDKGNQYLGQGKYREAIAEFNRALLLDPTSEAAKRGVIKANQEIAARSAVPDVLTIERDRVNFHLSKGTEHYDAGMYDEAMAEWEQVLEIDPANKLAHSLIEAAKRAKVDYLLEKGHDEFFGGDVDAAISTWEEARSIVPASKVLDDLITQAHEVRHAKEMGRIDAELKVEMQRVSEFINQKDFLPEGADADGIKRKDESLRPTPAAKKEFGAREAIMKELSQPVAFDFECEPLRGVIKFLIEITGINILVDEEVFEQYGKLEDCYGNKVERKEIFVTINVSELPLESALNGMLRQHGLGFSIERDFIYVSVPDVLRGQSFEQLETRFYHLQDTSRLSLPKIDVSGSASTVSLGTGGRTLDLASGGSLVGRVRTPTSQQLQEVEPDYYSMSVPKLVNILRSFIPAVLDPSKQTTGRRTAVVGQDRKYGGLRRGTDQFQLFDSPRLMWADASGREILSLIDFDPHTNTLIIRNTPTNLDMIEVFLDHLDQKPRQIAVESRFISYSITEARKVGIDFTFGGVNAIGGFSGLAEFSADTLSDGSFIDFSLNTDIGDDISGDFEGRGGNMVFRYTKSDGDFLAATINMLSELRNTRVVSAPRLVTLNNKPAVIQDIVTRSFRSDLTVESNIVTPEAGQTTTTTSIDQEFTDVTEGVTLSITPQIQPDNTIRLFILPDVAQIIATDEFETETGSEGQVIVNTVTRPQVARQSIFTNVVVDDGDTIVIGGLIQNRSDFQNTGVPFFKDIPLIGRVFENETQVNDMTNLLIFITVNIMDSRGVAYTRLK
ncbi:MAG: tetratricopeptide repeat protein [Candidatus Abyssobacteria bacterium SURF_17]|uniref:Tetratricopeptide repeat protein n=1 Tax=Candidatus Abyssobacteria bacterium SURF_17 TaxID=2093361 RepID=A0A419F1L9_9BACT|nr:MAG: tetratricopeptide repeat protein [Candidatus Abyssubacteria bacterium SURF_17]